MTSATGTWTSTTDAASVADWITDRGRVLLLTHTKPDGDAMGSTLAIARAINLHAKRNGVPGVAATPWYAGPMPGWAGKLAGGTRTKTIEEDGAPDSANFEGLVITDTGSWGQLEPFAAVVRAMGDRSVVIDHHLQGNADVSERRLLDTDAAAVVQPAADICCALLGLASPAELPSDIATPLYFGLATDTGWFKHSNVGPRVFTLASQLSEAGVGHAGLYAMSEQTDRESRARLLGRALTNMEIACDGRLALMPLSVQDVHDCKAGPGDTGGFADPALAIERVRVVVVLTEVPPAEGEPPRVKLSFRSKAAIPNGPGLVDVNKIAGGFGGGGHAQAAGARPEGTLESVQEALMTAIGPVLDQAEGK